MQFVGKYLKKSREEKHINIDLVSKNLHISIDLIKKIESDDFLNYMDISYLTGHVRAYAKYLDLDANEIIKHFKIQTSFSNNKSFEELPKPLEKNNFFNFSIIFSFSSVIFISFFVYFLFLKPNDLQPSFTITPDLPENLQFEIEESEMQTVLDKRKKIDSLTKNNEFIISDLENKIKDSESFLNESSVIASLQSTEDLNNFVGQITLKFLSSTWIQLRNNQDQIIFSKLMNKEDEYLYLISDNYSLTTGNAGNIIVLINGQTRGRVGKKGEVIDSLIIHSEFNN